MKEKLLKLKEEILEKLEDIKDSTKLKEVEEKYFSRKRTKVLISRILLLQLMSIIHFELMYIQILINSLF